MVVHVYLIHAVSLKSHMCVCVCAFYKVEIMNSSLTCMFCSSKRAKISIPVSLVYRRRVWWVLSWDKSGRDQGTCYIKIMHVIITQCKLDLIGYITKTMVLTNASRKVESKLQQLQRFHDERSFLVEEHPDFKKSGLYN